ncbi:MAG: sugar kinase [Elusimicrobia bacterium]|nr:sugar kinase [Elusimicrobiota bacterium]
MENGSSILVVGSVALDSVVTPKGESREALGGSATYFSLSASFFSKVLVVGVVGEDFPNRHRRVLEERSIDLSGLQVIQKGKTFRWVGEFGKDLNQARTLETHLNVFEHFRPKLEPEQKEAPVVFLANIDPELQWEVLAQMTHPKLVACDTMNYWISSKRAALKELLSQVHIFFVNEEEVKLLTQEENVLKAGRILSEWGPEVVVIKKGENGALLLAEGQYYAFPAYPVEDVVDPTGAGDTFAGGFLGYLAGAGSSVAMRDVQQWKRAAVHGSVMASFTVEDFSTRRLEGLASVHLEERYRKFLELLRVEDPSLILPTVG